VTQAQPDWGLDGLDLGISLGGIDGVHDWRKLMHWVELAESIGLHSVWLPEAHFVRGGVATPLVLLAAFAARTQRLRLATTSLLLPIHDPRAMAREVATLDHLSQGRVILGLGRGFRRSLFEAFGVDAAQKRDLFDESLDQMLSLWRGEGEGEDAGKGVVERENETPTPPPTPGSEMAFTPSQRPHPPLAVAAFGRKGLAQAARRALPYLASPIESFDAIADNLSFHGENLPEGTDRSGLVVPIMRTVFVSRDPATLTRVMARLDGEVSASPRKLPKAISQALAAPIESRVVVGTPESVIDQLARYRDELGMNLVIARPSLAGIDLAEQEDSLRCLWEEVMPALRASG
jgi:alkanesulfonate monooxygenase SsuD/methylene tetrahydromethanopterin reductase-like flavin-dependent oxidoreductase (luciferase family)